jgi:hypothetical protein
VFDIQCPQKAASVRPFGRKPDGLNAYCQLVITTGHRTKESSGHLCKLAKIGENEFQRAPTEAYEVRLKYVLAIVLLAVVTQAKEPKHYQSGKLLKMESVKCGTDAKNGKSLAGEMIGTDSAHLKTREMLCQQYVLETDNVVYTIRPKEDKHPVLLPIGEKAQFRMDKDKIVLRVEDLDDKEREYEVVSMVPKDSADATANSFSSARPASK